MTPATVYNYLVRNDIPLRTKSVGVSRAKGKTAFVRLTDIAGHVMTSQHWNARYWNARWLVASGKVKATKSLLTKDQAEALKVLLDEYGDSPAFPEDRVEKAFIDIRKHGFPYLTLDQEGLAASWRRLLAAKPEKIEGRYNWTGIDTSLPTTFHPHIYECRKNGKLSPLELFSSDEDLKRAIRKALCLHGKLNYRLINDLCRNENAAGRVGNFPPRVGKAIINELWPDETGLKVLDPCAGFSGRLVSCACSQKVASYLGVDLSPKTFAGLNRTVEFLRPLTQMKMEIRHGDCTEELATIPDENYDFVITSPPFFDVEEYVGVRLYDQYPKWRQEFLVPMIKQCANKLRRGGKMAVYIENVGKHLLPKDSQEIAVSAGLRLEAPIVFNMHYGTSRRLNAGRGIEILVWTKP